MAFAAQLLLRRRSCREVSDPRRRTFRKGLDTLGALRYRSFQREEIGSAWLPTTTTECAEEFWWACTTRG